MEHWDESREGLWKRDERFVLAPVEQTLPCTTVQTLAEKFYKKDDTLLAVLPFGLADCDEVRFFVDRSNNGSPTAPLTLYSIARNSLEVFLRELPSARIMRHKKTARLYNPPSAIWVFRPEEKPLYVFPRTLTETEAAAVTQICESYESIFAKDHIQQLRMHGEAQARVLEAQRRLDDTWKVLFDGFNCHYGLSDPSRK
jgi:hypothetical protein